MFYPVKPNVLFIVGWVQSNITMLRHISLSHYSTPLPSQMLHHTYVHTYIHTYIPYIVLSMCWIFYFPMFRAEQSSNLLLVFASTVILGFGPRRDHYHIFVCSKTTYVFWNGASSTTRGGVWLLLSTTGDSGRLFHVHKIYISLCVKKWRNGEMKALKLRTYGLS
jgi:hypothetical protein